MPYFESIGFLVLEISSLVSGISLIYMYSFISFYLLRLILFSGAILTY